MPGKKAPQPKRYHGYIPFREVGENKLIGVDHRMALLNTLPMYSKVFRQPSAAVHFEDEIRQVETNHRGDNVVIWRANFSMEATLQFKDFYRAGHSMYSEWLDVEGTLWPIPLSAVEEIIARVGIPQGGKLTHTKWTFTKKGTSYFTIPEWVT